MKRIEMACYALLASSFALAGILAVQVHQRGGVAQSAQAEMVVTRDNLTVMTARTKNDEEALFVLDNFSQRLLIFTCDLAKKRLNPAAPPIMLTELFGTNESRTSAPPPRRTR